MLAANWLTFTPDSRAILVAADPSDVVNDRSHGLVDAADIGESGERYQPQWAGDVGEIRSERTGFCCYFGENVAVYEVARR